MFLTASHIIPIEGPDLSPGVIEIEEDTIIRLGGKELLQHARPDDILDLGDMVLLPGFVNAHCHLELTSLGPLEMATDAGQRPFVPWIRELVKKKNNLESAEVETGIQEGIKTLMQSGVTTIGDHISFNTPWKTIVESPLRGKLFGEVLGILPEVARDIYSSLKTTKQAIQKKNSLFEMHISPHSVHSVHPSILKEVMLNEPAPLSIHLAESQSEDDYFKKSNGSMMELIRQRYQGEIHQAQSGLQWLEENHLPLFKIMLIHGNYLDNEDCRIIRKNKISLIHCPGSHSYFGHQAISLEDYLSQGIIIGLGTDSIASNQSLNFLEELKLTRKKFPQLEAHTLLKMATLHGARALRMEKEIGSLVPGKKADIVGFTMLKECLPKQTPFQQATTNFLMINGQIFI